jgi:hypothetical protein
MGEEGMGEVVQPVPGRWEGKRADALPDGVAPVG